MSNKSSSKNKTKKILTILLIPALIFSILFLIIKNNKTEEGINGSKFPKGVLAINTNRATYEPKEKVVFGMASLDENGNTLCNSNLEIVIEKPNGEKETLSTTDKKIFTSNTCNENNNVTSNPDYISYFYPAETGLYKITLINKSNDNKVKTQIEVKNDSKFTIERSGATRINPFATDRYHMSILFQSKEDFKGKLIETIPSSVNVVWQGRSIVEERGEIKTITWDLDIKANESIELIYEYQAPKISPDFFTFGPIELIKNNEKVYEEVRSWQIASDDMTFIGADYNDEKTRDISCNVPTGTTQNDIMFALVSMYSNTVRSVPTGWSTLGSYTSSSDKYYLYYKIAGSSEPSSYTWGVQSNAWGSVTIATYRGGFDIDDPIDTLSNTAYRTSNTAVQAASMNVTYGVSPLIFFGSVYSTSTLSFTKPSVPNTDWVEDLDYYNDSGDFGRTFTSMTWGNSGPTGAISALSSLTTTTKHAFALALNPPIADITGTVYTNEAKTSNIGSGKTVSLYVNNVYKDSVDTNSSGQFSFTDITGVGTGNVVIIYLDDETENGSTVIVASDTDISADIITDRVTLENSNGGDITNDYLNLVYSVDATNEDGITISSGNLTVADSYELFIPSGETFAPGGNVSTPKLHIKGTYTGGYETLTLTGSGTGACNTSQSLTLPLCVDSGGTYDYNDNNTIFTGTGNSHIQGMGYNNLYLLPTITGSVDYTFTGASTIGGDFTINPTSLGANTLTVNMGGDITVNFPGTVTISGTTSAYSILDTDSSNNYSLTSAFLNIRAPGTLQAQSSTITLTGSSYNAEISFYNSETWNAPQGISSISVKAWGGGGGGGGGTGTGGGGGGGGEFRQNTTVPVTPGNSYSVTIGQGGTGGYSSNGGNGGDSSFSTSVVAKGGNGGTLGGSGGTGGTGGTGTIGYAGGNGAAGSGSSGGGGGEGAGSTANGGNASGTTGGTGTDGGDGGAGATSRDGNGNPGEIPGGAGGGGGESKFSTTRGGAGRAGLVIIQYDSDIPVFTRVGTFTQGTSTVLFSQTTDDVVLNDGTITFYNMEINMSGYTGTLGNAITIQNDLDITAGTLDDGGNQITGNSTGTLTAASGTYLNIGSTSGGTSFPTLFTNGHINMDVDSTVTYQSGVAQNISGVPTYGNIIIESSGTINPSDTSVNVHGDWTCTGTLTPGTSTVYFNGSGAQSISGNTNFYNLDITTATTKTITFIQDAFVYILSGGNITFEGSSGNLLTLTSSSNGPWYLRLDPSASYSISYTNVSESNAGGYQTIYATDPTVVNGGLNVNWVFSSPTSGAFTNFSSVNMSGVDINK